MNKDLAIMSDCRFTVNIYFDVILAYCHIFFKYNIPSCNTYYNYKAIKKNKKKYI